MPLHGLPSFPLNDKLLFHTLDICVNALTRATIISTEIYEATQEETKCVNALTRATIISTKSKEEYL